MARSKRGSALFDLLGKDEAKAAETLKVPRWWTREGGRGERPAESQPTGEDPGASSRERTKRARPELGGMPPPADSPGEGRSEPVPFFEFDEDRIRISFTSSTAAVAVFLVAALLVVAFHVGFSRGERTGTARGFEEGRASYAAETIDEIAMARDQPADAGPIAGLLDDAVAAAGAGAPDVVDGDQSPAEAPGVGWIRDYTYIVAQEFSRQYADDAQDVQVFLRSHGIDTEAVVLERGSVQLITTLGYNRADPAQRQMSDRMLDRLHSVGAEYYAAGGGYKLQGYFKTLKGESW